MDQYEATKDDIVGQQYFAVYKRPSGSDHLLMDQEIGALVEEADESLYVTLAQQQGLTEPHVFEDSTKKDEPSQLLADNFTPHDDEALFMYGFTVRVIDAGTGLHATPVHLVNYCRLFHSLGMYKGCSLLWSRRFHYRDFDSI
jgi:hypothetical protein